MRNLIRIQDTLHSIQFQTSEGDKNVIAERLGDDNIVSIACSQALGKLYLLTASGILLCFENHDGLSWKYSTKLLFEDMVEDWFKVDYVAVTNTVVCISRQGSLVCIEEDAVDGNPIGEPDQIGVIEGGIVAASWHPDYSCLVIFTNNNTILSMSNSWEVLNEVQFPHKVVNSKADLSWKGDGEMLSIVSIDEVDGVSKVRILNPQLEIVATSRNVGEGAASVMKGIGCVVAFATNGAYVAAHQVKPGGEGHAVALVEKNGLKHGDFDIRTPAVPVQHKPWEVTALDWDLPSTLLAVAMRSYPIDKSSSTINFVGCVQVYYRENYHWYLKQQWVDHDLTWLGFDSELANRLYLSQLVEIPSLSGIIYDQALRVVDIYWSVSRTETRDSTVCVSDGSSLLLTPLGYHSVPPPMSMYQENLAAFQANWKFSVASQVSFWNTESARGKCWGMSTLLSDKADTVIHLGDDRGKVTKLFGFELDKTIESLLKSEVGGESEEVANELLLLIRQVRFRQVLITEGDGQVIVHFIGSKALSHYINIDLDAPLMISSRTGAQPVVADDFVVSLIATSNDFYAATTPDSAIVRNSGIFKAFRLLNGFTGAIYYASHIFNAVHDIALGVHHASTGDYEVVSLSHKDFQWTVDGEEVPIVLWLHQDDRQFERHVIATVPEVSPLFTVISNAQAIAEEEERLKAQAVAGISSSGASSTPALPSVDQEIKEFTVIALSNRNRLYCSDILLVAGASSYAFNHSFNLLMFITLGTKPHLHFSSLTTLQRLSAMQAADEEGVANGICFECAEARPVERGAKLVTSVANDSKVVIQLPRGNLEIFEPRPMILLKAQRLLVVDALSSVSPQLLECLVLLRRQRVDLNYLVDFNPVIFLEQAHNFVRQALGVAGSTYNQDRSDLLSLFITSLDPQDVTMTKYVYFDRTMFAQRVQRREYIIKNKFEQDTKVNRVCECLRQSLLTLLQEEHCLQAMNPLLCTYAKQRPPLLVDALKLIKSITTSSASGSSASVRGVSMTSAIKYLAFLAEGSQIFDAALGVCDFDMARAIARQCQMDPKVYLPLLEGFESIAKGFSITSSLGYLMLYRVNKHLKRNEVATEAFCKLIRTLHEDDVKWSNNDSGTLESEVAGGKIISKEQVQSLISTAEKELLPQVIEIVKEDNSFHTIMMRMNGLEKEFSRTLVSTSSSTQLIRRFITAVRKGYAEKQLSEMNYSGAITAFLSTHPPCAVEAVEAALSQGNWLNALSIAGRYHSSILDANGKKRSALDPTRIAQEIVSSYRSNQEFVSFMGDVEESEQQWVSASPPSSSMASDEEDKALLAARLSIDYCQDAESAVAILVTAQKWSRAIEVASQQHRLDLFDEIFPAARTAAKDLRKQLQDRTSKVAGIVQELTTLWQNPAERMANIATTDTDLLAELNEKDEKDGTDGHEINDTSSEFSAATRYSTSSLLSSTSSIRSGTSTVSILSDISDKSSASAAGSAAGSTAGSSFSISGLEHGLLSRGSANSFLGENRNANGKVYKRDRTPRRQKRIERSKAKGTSKGDVWGLRREKELVSSLALFANSLKFISKAVNDLCEVLLMADDSQEDQLLAIAVTTDMQKLVKTMQANTPPVAPAYPKEWLTKRSMAAMTLFQDPKKRLEEKLTKRYYGSVAGTTAATIAVKEIALLDSEVEELMKSKTYWQIAKEGIQFWFDSKLVHLQLEDDSNV